MSSNNPDDVVRTLAEYLASGEGGRPATGLEYQIAYTEAKETFFRVTKRMRDEIYELKKALSENKRFRN